MSGVRIAMWSGPRNISTALMRSWENRPDTRVVDEPLYAHYLSTTGLAHPAKDEVLASQSQDWREVVAELTAPLPEGRVFYQKHMTHHITPDVDLDWLDQLSNVFLIRTPEEVISSYGRVRDDITVEDLGFVQQERIFERVAEKRGQAPPVIDSRAVLENPEGVLRALCDCLELPFLNEMLQWPAGRRDSDGVWAPWWYGSVEKSTGFQPYRPKALQLTPQQRELAERCRPTYDKLEAFKITG